MKPKHEKKQQASSGNNTGKALGGLPTPAHNPAHQAKQDAVFGVAQQATQKIAQQTSPRASLAQAKAPQSQSAVASSQPDSTDFFSTINSEYAMPKSGRFRRGLKILGIVLGVLLGLIAAGYLAGAVFFMGHFLPGTVINGVDVSLKTPEDTSAAIASSLDDYKLQITGYSMNCTFTGKNISYRLDPSHDILSYFNPWAWPLELASNAGKQASFSVLYDTSAVEASVTSEVDACNATATKPEDAHLAYDAASDTVSIVPEQQGTTLNAEQVITDVHAALKAATPTLELSKRDLVLPAVYSTDDNLNNAVALLNSQWNVNVTLTLGGYPALKINKGDLLDWLVYDNNHNVSLNEEAITAWAQEKAEKLNTYGTEHTYTRPDGKEITVTGDTAFGWELDTEALTETIVSAIKNGEQGEIAIPCTNEGAYYNLETGAEWASFVDVDLSEQHAYYYNDSGELLWESDIISGNVNYASRATPTGVFSITRKATNERLYTYEEGKEKPNECTVAYWMPFIGNVYALHDAWWQPGFGGTMYRDGYGSHGCVNLPSDKAAELFNLVEVGTVVVVHW